MKIVDFSVTMSKWASPPWQTATAAFGSEKLLGVLTLRTDEGVEGRDGLRVGNAARLVDGKRQAGLFADADDP